MSRFETLKRKFEKLHGIKMEDQHCLIYSNDFPCGAFSKIVEISSLGPSKDKFYFEIPFNPDNDELLFERSATNNDKFKSASLIYSNGKYAIFKGSIYRSQFFSIEGGIEKIWFVEIATKQIIKKMEGKYISTEKYRDETVILIRQSNGMLNYFNLCGEKINFLPDFHRICHLGNLEFFKNEIGIISAYNILNYKLFDESFQSLFKLRKDKICVQRISGEWCYIDTDHYQVYPVTISGKTYRYVQFFTDHSDKSLNNHLNGYILKVDSNICEIPDTAKAFVYFESPYDFKKVPDTKFLGNRYNFSTIFCVIEHKLCEMEFKRRKIDPSGAITDIVPGLPVELISAKKHFDIIPDEQFARNRTVFKVSSEI